MAEGSSKVQISGRQSFFFMFFVKSIKANALTEPERSEVHPQIKFYVNKGTQVLNSTRQPLTLNFENGWMKVQKLQLPFLLKDSHSNEQMNFTIKMVEIDNLNESVIEQLNLRSDSSIRAYLNQGVDRTEYLHTFGNYRVRFLVFIDRNRRDLEKLVKAYRDSEQFRQWSASKQYEAQNMNPADEKKEQNSQPQQNVIVKEEQQVVQNQVYQELVVDETEKKTDQIPQKNDETESPTQVLQEKPTNNLQINNEVEADAVMDKSSKNQQNQVNVSEVVEVSQTYIINDDANKKEQQFALQEKTSNELKEEPTQIKEKIENNSFSEIKQRSSELQQDQTPQKNPPKLLEQQTKINSSFVKKSGAGVKTSDYYDRKQQYYEPPKQQEEQSPLQFKITKHHQHHQSDQKPTQEQQPTTSGTGFLTAEEENKIFEQTAGKAESMVEVGERQQQQPPEFEYSQVIESVGNESTPTQTKSSDWKLTFKIFLIIILVCTTAFYIMRPHEEQKLFETQKKQPRPKAKHSSNSHNSGSKKAK